jgi:hypothetical protein
MVRKAKKLDLDQPEHEKLRELLTGPSGYGVPKYTRGYPLIGGSTKTLAPVFDFCTNPDVPDEWCPEWDWSDPPFFGLAISSMSFDFWEKFMAKVFPALQKEETKWYYVNTWRPKKNLMVIVYKTDNGEYFHFPFPNWADPWVLLLRSTSVRLKTSSSRAEKKARKELVAKLSREQKRQLTLTGSFVEIGRSGVHYLIRFNRPTIAYRQKKARNGMKSTTFLASMCMHPLGYYYRTYVGCLAPSDEMLSHLLLIRTDEVSFWRDANQHDLDDALGGVA